MDTPFVFLYFFFFLTHKGEIDFVAVKDGKKCFIHVESIGSIPKEIMVQAFFCQSKRITMSYSWVTSCINESEEVLQAQFDSEKDKAGSDWLRR